MIWFALVCISFCRIFFLPFCVLTQQRRGPIWCIYIYIYLFSLQNKIYANIRIEIVLINSSSSSSNLKHKLLECSRSFSVKWTHRYFCCFTFNVCVYYYVHRDNELWMRTLGMRVCVYVRNVLCMSSCSPLLMMIKTYSVIQKELRLYVFARAIAQIYLPRLSQF